MPPRDWMAAIASAMRRRVVGRAGGRLDRGAERRHDHRGRPCAAREASRRAAALTMSMRRFRLWLLSMSSVNVVGMSCSCTRSSDCAHAVLGDREVVLLEPRDVAAVLVLHRGFDQHRRHAGLLEDLERRQVHVVADDDAGRRSRRRRGSRAPRRGSRRSTPRRRAGRPRRRRSARRRRRNAPAARRRRPGSAPARRRGSRRARRCGRAAR